ncbi:unnamed protein product [Lactuca saligna]|uniref:MULE transposase domain-containing protein n=1 Tax=Lactuca saligna TaxID=75948 RepID=A0AA35Y8H3_LACSI|nr:unnamed protein product [Lactuca saligna]
MNIDKDVEWVGGSSESNVPEDTQQGDLEVINTEVLLSGSSSDEANDGKRRKTIRAIHRAYENDAALGKAQALKHVQGDYASQYRLLRDYVLEVQARNPDTTVKIDVESEANPTVETRTFRRIYVCIGALKRGFAAGRRDFLGLDGAFVKGPYLGQVLSVVALDGNNGIYPLAYVVVESETLNSWTWFLSNLGDDLGLGTNSNFTFMSDRQKGLLPAIATLFPCAEHRYCLRHIHDNMKKNWRGKVFKDLLWECATTSNVQHFHQAMEKLKKLNNDAYEWLKQIPPQSLARSHFTGREHCDALTNNLCEAFNSKIEDGHDAPIINCIEFIREYIMKKIVKVDKEIQKVVGPLTPTATTILDKIKSKAEQSTKLHVKKVGINRNSVQTWCGCYLKTWGGMTKMWESHNHLCIHVTGYQAGKRCILLRPKKKRSISIVEKEDFVRGNTASRAHRSVTCTKCNNVGHNAKTCKGQRPIIGGGGGQSQVKGKGKGKATT